MRLSAEIDYKTGKPKRTSTCCNTRQEAIAILQQQAHEVRTQGWRDPMSVTLGEWYEYWLDTYMKDTVKQSTYASYRSYLNKHFCVLGKILLKKLEPHTLQEFYNYKFREEGLCIANIFFPLDANQRDRFAPALLNSLPAHRPCRREKRHCLGAFASYRRGSRPAKYRPKFPAFRGFFYHKDILPRLDFPVQVNPTQISTK